ncbi:hypothetical protein ACFYWY_36435 [Streptomyces sp. NPDC002870]|uniref:hypothetical protein n=1 Tax=Streptomyces sp. NPDC002870 TaxID=3364666 RepID=UPI0036A10C8A
MAIDDAEAAPVVHSPQEQTGIWQAPELKFALSKNRANQRAALNTLLGAGRCPP